MIVIGLPLSKAFMSIGSIVLAVNFLLEGNLKERFRRLWQLPVPTLTLLIFVIHVVGLLWSDDLGRSMGALRLRLPILLLPIVIPLSKPLRPIEFKAILWLFIGSVLVTSALSTNAYLGIKDDPSADFRSISLFTSHIRYSLMVCLSYLFLLHFAWHEKKRIWLRLLYIGLAIWMSVFVFILQSMTGIVIWLLCSYLLLLYTMAYLSSPRVRTVSLTLLIATPLFVSAYLIMQVDAFYPDQAPDFSSLEAQTDGGEHYKHDTTNLTLENGFYVNFYLAYQEMEREWNERSDIPFWGGKDRSGHAVNATLIRYLTSKGLRKDSVGVNALTEEDIDAIESGVANVRFTYGNPIDNRVYIVIWEIDRMINQKGVQGHSVAQRLVYWKTGWEIFKENWLIGVGTGSAQKAFKDMYERNDSKLSQDNRLRAHNQFLSMGIYFGVFGLAILLLSFIAPFMLLKNANSFVYIGFAIVLYASMLNEDTLETQAGLTLYAVFHMLLLYGVESISSAFASTDE